MQGRFISIVTIAAMVMFCGTAMAGILPTGGCGESGCPDGATGRYTLDDLGVFDGDAWIWDADFATKADQWLSNNDPNWQTTHAPFKVVSPALIYEQRMDRRIRPNPDQDNTRIVLKARGEGIATNIPILWGAGCFKEVDGFGVPCECDDPEASQFDLLGGYECDESGSCNIQFEEASATTEPIEVISLDWNGVEGEANLYSANTDTTMLFVPYNINTRFWEPVKFYRWDGDYRFKYYHLPDLGPQQLTLTTSAGVFPLEFNVVTNHDLPAIPGEMTGLDFIKIRENGKSKKKSKDVTYQNIVVREVDDPKGGKALVIQWGEPEAGLFGGRDVVNGGYNLRVYVGQSHMVDTGTSTEVHLWIDCPGQLGTVVVENETYELFKTEVLNKGLTLEDITVFITYREVYPGYHNRARSDYVRFTPSD